MSNAPENYAFRSKLRSIDELAVAYARVLEAVWSMPVFGRGDPRYVVLDSDGHTPWVRRLGWPGLLVWWLRIPFIPIRGWWRSFVIRPVVSFYATTHINGNASKLHESLVRKRLAIGDDESDSNIGSLDESIAGLERLRTVTTSWVALLVLLRFVPLLGLLFSMGVITVSVTLADAGGIVQNLIGTTAAVMFIVHPIAVQFGFRWKRALFAGGGEIAASSTAGDEHIQSASARLPETNVYKLEQRVFEDATVKRFHEVPVDLLLAPGYYFLFNLLTGLIAGTTTFDADSTSSEAIFGNIVVVSVFAGFFLMATARLVLRYKLRRASSDY